MATFNKRGYKEPKPKAEKLDNNYIEDVNVDAKDSATAKAFDTLENVASPHIKYQDKIIPIKYISWDNIAPAGGINSNVLDMSKWIKLQLNRGEINNLVNIFGDINSDEASVLSGSLSLLSS